MSKTPILTWSLAVVALFAPRLASAAGTTLNGSGSTLSKPYQETAIEEFKKGNKGVTLNYGGGGSGKGRQDLADMVVDFAGSDSAYKDADLLKAKGGEVLYFPILLGPITVSYNVAGVDKLQLSAETIAKIMGGNVVRLLGTTLP